jgi:outer membrane protein assembly factor BamD
MRRPVLFALALAVTGGACFGSFNTRDYSTSAALYAAGMKKYRDGKYADAATAFERLTLDLPTRDTLLPLAHWYLGWARLKHDERLLAAQAFIRLSETVPDDTLADDALLMSGRSYRGLWKRPSLDPQYGLLAQTQFRLLIGVYPQSALLDTAQMELKRIDEMFASKDYETGMHYRRRKAYDSAIIFFKDVVKNFPETDRARQAMLRMVEIYRLPELDYKEDAAEMCDALRAAYPSHPEVVATCKVSPTGRPDSTATGAAQRP